jgi:hypothetical protein
MRGNIAQLCITLIPVRDPSLVEADEASPLREYVSILYIEAYSIDAQVLPY